METATIIIATFGDQKWQMRAERLALTTELTQHSEVIAVHSDSLAHARNEGTSRASGDWLCFLDADDALEEDYVAKMLAGTGDLRAPRLFFTEGNKEPWEPFDLTERDMRVGNPCAIGTFVRKEMFDTVGGFQGFRAWEDWAMFQRCWMIGADIVHHDAIYFAEYDPESRNNTVYGPTVLHSEIVKSNQKWLRKYNRAI